MEEEITEISVGQFDTVSQLIASSLSLQLAVAGLIIGIIIIAIVYTKFSRWVKSQKMNHTKPHVARFSRKIILPFLAIALISSVNVYIQAFELFDDEEPISIIGNEYRYNLAVTDVDTTHFGAAGKEHDLSIEVKNVGLKDQDDVVVSAQITDVLSLIHI